MATSLCYNLIGDFMKEILFTNQDLKYKAFHEKLMPTINQDTVIGVRTPVLKKVAKEYYGSELQKKFIKKLPHKYYEENNLHAFFIAEIKDFDECVEEIEKFLPYIDNWATCDGLRSKCFKKNAKKLLPYIEKWMKSEHTYTVRFAMEMLMVYFLDELFAKKYPEMGASVKSEEYYIKMMQAWYFATALAKQWESVFPYITDNKLPLWVHNKTIRKAIESFRITEEQKRTLRQYKR